MATGNITKSFRKEDVTRDWWVVDAEDQTVGRIATRIAHLLRGKHKAHFTPHVDCGDCVVVINAEKVKFTGKRVDKKDYFHHTGWIGGGKVATAKEILAKHPERIIESAVKGMVPKNRLGRQIIKKLKVYAGTEHPHTAQQPKQYEIVN